MAHYGGGLVIGYYCNFPNTHVHSRDDADLRAENYHYFCRCYCVHAVYDDVGLEFSNTLYDMIVGLG